MGRKTPFQIVCLVLFVAFAAVSCYLTVSSIYLSMSEIPQWCLWIAIVGLFLLTSYGSKMIMDSFNRNLIVDNRGKKLAGGLVIVAITWLMISFPTNSHSLFYNKNARDFAKSEELYLIQQLQQLTNEEAASEKFMAEFDKKISEVKAAKTALKAEIEHPERPGVGDHAERCLQRVEEALGVKVNTITRLSSIGRTQREENPVDRWIERNRQNVLIVTLTVLIVIGYGVFLFKKCSSNDSSKGESQEETQTAVTDEKKQPQEMRLDASDTLKVHSDMLNSADKLTFIAPDSIKVKEWRIDGFNFQDSTGNKYTAMVNKSNGDTVTISFTTDKNVKYKHQFIVK